MLPCIRYKRTPEEEDIRAEKYRQRAKARDKKNRENRQYQEVYKGTVSAGPRGGYKHVDAGPRDFSKTGDGKRKGDTTRWEKSAEVKRLEREAEEAAAVRQISQGIDWSPREPVFVSESTLEKDPELPASRVKLADHPRGADWCLAQAIYWRAAGFLPVAVSRLVGLRLSDISKLMKS